jgi:hypothetical protein
VTNETRNIIEYLRLDEHKRGRIRADINRDLFFDRALLQPLEHVFQGKCAFCESGLGSDGIVLHLRPMARPDGHDDHPDHYLWLAFEWRNLFYACPHCSKSKADAFPVEGNRAPFRPTYDDVVAHEVPLLLDPTRDEPATRMLTELRFHASEIWTDLEADSADGGTSSANLDRALARVAVLRRLQAPDQPYSTMVEAFVDELAAELCAAVAV